MYDKCACGKKKTGRSAVCRTCYLRKTDFSELGARGHAALVKKYGRVFAVEKQREYRLSNPSRLERNVIEALDELGVSYEREVLYKVPGHEFYYLIDFVCQGQAVVEVMGIWAHQHHARRDAEKRGWLTRSFPTYIEIDEMAALHPAALRAALVKGLGLKQVKGVQHVQS